jgi:hypothetical protein
VVCEQLLYFISQERTRAATNTQRVNRRRNATTQQTEASIICIIYIYNTTQHKTDRTHKKRTQPKTVQPQQQRKQRTRQENKERPSSANQP